MIHYIIAQYGRYAKDAGQQQGRVQNNKTNGSAPAPNNDNIDDLIRNGVAIGHRSEVFSRVVWSRLGAGYTVDAIEQELREYSGGIAGKYLAPKDRLREEIDRCYEKWRRVQPEGESPLEGPARTAITLKAGELHEVVTKCEQALIAAGVPFYVRDGQVVRPVIEEVAASNGRKTKVARIREVGADMMRDKLSQHILFTRYNKTLEKDVPADPSRDIACTLLARDGDWAFPPLVGVISAPTLRPDGSVLLKPGYDRATRRLLIDSVAMQQIPESPTRSEAIDCIKLIEDLLEEFPFADKASKATALSMIITAIVRPAMACAPMHVSDAPEAGSGKSYLADLCATIASGNLAAVTSAGPDLAETEKRLATALIVGQQFVVLDNLNGELGGDYLCQAIDRSMLDTRILGRSESRRIFNTHFITGNGNNIKILSDMVRRVVMISMDANLEKPEMRQFKKRPVETVLADRGL